MILSFVVLLIIAYLLGSISSAILVCKLFKLPDPRTTGSKNPGATNVMRTGGKSKAAIVLLGDALKGVIPVLIAEYLLLPPWQIGLVGFFAVLGHIFSIFYHGKGGKGVATALGVYFAFAPWLGLVSVLTWLLIFKIFRYSSLASIMMVSLAPICAWILLPGTSIWVPFALMGALILYKHRQNIGRLGRGTEPKFEKNQNLKNE
jgi:glycerol-3-phosphate acyltransferase PlsY